MRVNGSLLGAFIAHSTTTAVVVIDEDSSSDGANEHGNAASPALNATARQQRVIAVAQRFGCPVFLVQPSESDLNPVGIRRATGRPDDYPENTRTSLKGLLPFNKVMVTKSTPNAFRGTGFHDYLQQHHGNISRLLLMGWSANACVGRTAGIFDAYNIEGAMYDPGATHLGYTVMSCDDVLHGGPSNWVDDNGQACRASIEFYSAL